MSAHYLPDMYSKSYLYVFVMVIVCILCDRKADMGKPLFFVEEYSF